MPAVEDFVPPSPNSIVEEEFTPPPPVEARPAREELLKLMGQARAEGSLADWNLRNWTQTEEMALAANAPFKAIPRGADAAEISRVTGINPTAAKWISGAGRGAASLVEAIETPMNVATLGVSTASKTLAKIAAGTYGWFIGKELPAAAAETGKLAGEGDIEGAVETGIGTVAGAVLAPTLAKHALTRVAPLTAAALEAKGVSADAQRPIRRAEAEATADATVAAHPGEQPLPGPFGPERTVRSDAIDPRQELIPTPGTPADQFGAVWGPFIGERAFEKLKTSEFESIDLPSESGTDFKLRQVGQNKIWLTASEPTGGRRHNLAVAYLFLNPDGTTVINGSFSAHPSALALKAKDKLVSFLREVSQERSRENAAQTPLVSERQIILEKVPGPKEEVSPSAQKQKEIQEEGDAVAPAQGGAPEPAPIGMGGATPAEFKPPPGTPTGIKNATVDAERVKRGLPAAMEPLRRSFGEVWDRAMARMDQDPMYQDRLLGELRENPRALTDIEDATLIHRQVDMQNEYAKATRDLAQAFDDGRLEDVADQKARVSAISDQLLELYDLNKRVGTETGRGLAARRQMVNEDFSLAGLEMQKRAAKGGAPLTDAERIEIGRIAKEFEMRNAALQQRVAQLEAQGKTGRQLDSETLRLKFRVEETKKNWQEGIQRDIRATRSVPERFLSNVSETVNLARSILTSFDLSAVLRQGGFIGFAHPVRAAKAIPSMLRALRSEEGQFRVMEEIRTRPNYKAYSQAGLYLAEQGTKLSKMEEAYMSRLASKIPGVAASERAYTTYLNRLRADSFDAMARTLSRDGKLTPAEAKAIGNFVNVATGRGSLGMKENAMVGLNTVFFAPRYVASRFQLLGLQPLYRGSARTRTAIAKEYARYLTGISVVYGLGMLDDAEIERDPRSADFGKMRYGNTRLDPMSGLSQTTVVVGRLGSGETKTQIGQVVPIRGERVPYGGTTSMDVMSRFARSKLAPIPSQIVNVIVGKDFKGDPVTAASVAKGLLVPIGFSDIAKVMEDQGVSRGTAFTMLSLMGMGLQVYEPRSSGKPQKLRKVTSLGEDQGR